MTASRSASRFLATARVARSIAAALLLLSAATNTAHAVSAGCAALAAQDWNYTGVTAGSITIPRGPFDVGDVIELTASGSSGTARVMDSPFTTAVISISLTASPQTQTYSVPTAGTYALSVLGPVNFTSSARCVTTPPPGPTPDNASYDRAVTKGFLLSRINGMLLNSPGAMSLVNRNNTTVAGPRVASAGNGAASAAGGAAAFASAMGLGAGLGASRGDAVGRGASRFDDTAEEATLGSRNLQFSQSLSGLRRQAADERMKRERMSLGAGDGATLPLAYEITSPWDIWVEGRYSGFSDDAGNIDRDGHVGLLYVGGDYRVAQNMIVGVLAQFDWAKDDSGVLGSSVDGNVLVHLHRHVWADHPPVAVLPLAAAS